jgi:hypothetical protein
MTGDGENLLHCLGVGLRAARGGPPVLDEASWALLLRQAIEQGLGPLLYHRLRAVAPSAVPAPVRESLRETALRGAAQGLQISRDLATVLEALDREGIPTIALKGAHLAHLVYSSVGLRMMCDLDVLVPRAQLERAADVLAGLGYLPQFHHVEDVDYTRHHHLRPMARPGGTRVELHWNIVRPTALVKVEPGELWERATPATIAGVATRVLSPEDLVLHLCLHTSLGHKFAEGLRTCWDLSQVIDRYGDTLDWEALVRRAERWGGARYVYLTLRLVREVLGVAIPPGVLGTLEPPGFSPTVVAWARQCLFTRDGDEGLSPSLAKLWTARRLSTKLRVLGEALWPSPAAMARIYRRPAGSRRFYLDYLVRWADVLFRYWRHVWRLWRGDPERRRELTSLSQRAALHEWLRRGD